MREKELVTRVLYVRHGLTDYPVDRIYCDKQEDPRLNAKGLEQAKRTAALLKDVNVAAIYASPSARTCMTANEIALSHGLDVSAAPVLREREFGEWDGLYFYDIKSRYPDGFCAWKQAQAEYVPAGGESMFDVLSRLSPWVDALIQKHKGQTIVVVSHVGPIRALVCSAIGLGLERYRRLNVDNASVSCVDYGDGQNNLIFMNFSGVSGLS